MNEWAANENAAFASTRGRAGLKVGNGSSVTVISTYHLSRW